MRARRTRLVAALAASVALVLSACGGDGGEAMNGDSNEGESVPEVGNGTRPSCAGSSMREGGFTRPCSITSRSELVGVGWSLAGMAPVSSDRTLLNATGLVEGEFESSWS